MISRNYIACETCGHVHILRIQVGHADRQEHTFNCINCKEPIKVALNADSVTASTTLVPLQNCVQTDRQEGSHLYLSSEFVADKDRVHDEFYFPSAEAISDLANSHEGLRLFRQINPNEEWPEAPQPINDLWGSIKKSWRLSNAGQHAIAGKLISEFADKHGLPAATLSENIWYFLNGFFPFPQELRQELKLTFKNSQIECERFIHYYLTELRPHHRRSQFEILSEYFDAFQQHSQVMLYVRGSIPLRDSAHATSIEFDRVKGFYAKTYEFFAGEICILTCINNIQQGRPFDQLKRISLKEYLETDKAKRRDSISTNPTFASVTKEFDSSLRNASYHNWFFLREDHSTIEYRTGGTRAVRTLTYTEYLYRCGLLFRQICLLFIFELELDQIGNEIARRKLSV